MNQELCPKNCGMITVLNDAQFFPYFNGTGILPDLGPKLWHLVSNELK